MLKVLFKMDAAPSVRVARILKYKHLLVAMHFGHPGHPSRISIHTQCCERALACNTEFALSTVQRTPLNGGHPRYVTDSSESPDRFSIRFNTLKTPE